MAKTIGEATMTAATKTPMITPVYADEAVEAKQEVRRVAKAGGSKLIRIPAHPDTCSDRCARWPAATTVTV